ncbi:MAG: hypothetical protein V7767_12205, partial [Leeuwenhoekiella sp.]
KNFTDEIIPALVDLGGGSGTGSYFMDDNRWPEEYNHVPMMADWGRSELFIHRVEIDGASFKQKEEKFLSVPQITDIDVDGSGRMYLSAWDGAGYSGSDSKGYVIRVVPKGWKYSAFPNVHDLPFDSLVPLLKSDNAVPRFYAQREMLSRSKEKTASIALDIAKNEQLPLRVRVAGIYTYAQATCGDGVVNLEELSQKSDVREFALRAMADRNTCSQNVPVEPFIKALKDPSDRVKIAAIIGLGRLGRPEIAKELLSIKVPESLDFDLDEEEGLHAKPNAELIPAHLAVRALIKLNATQVCLDAIGSKNTELALWALRYMHTPQTVDGLIKAYQNTTNDKSKREITATLARLYKMEKPYDGTTWWGTRPDTHGPYYTAITWDSSDKIKNFLINVRNKNSQDQAYFQNLNNVLAMNIPEFEIDSTIVSNNDVVEHNIDLESIKNKKGQVGKASIEDVIRALSEIEGNSAEGKNLFEQQGCIVCHSVAKSETLKGPFMGQIGSIMNRDQIAESILKPNASISQGFATVLVTTKDNKSLMGFVTGEFADHLELRDITGMVTTVYTKDISKREELSNSMMPTGLANALSYEEFASLVTYLSQQK